MKIHLYTKYDLQKQFPLNKGAAKSLVKALLQFLYRDNLKNREFGKEAAENFGLERATIAGKQGASEGQNFHAKLTTPKTDFSSCFGTCSLHKEVSLYFVSVSRISKLHEEFFQDPSPTDCISFPLNGDHLGEIFVCPKVAIEYAAKRGLDPYQELTLYVVHGILHCLGFDDLEPSQRRTMRKKEKACMEFLKNHKLFLKP